MSSSQQGSGSIPAVVKALGVFFCLYLFIVGVTGMGDAFKMFGKDFANSILAVTENPFAALFMGVLATSLVQSSSTSTSIIVGMVAGGALKMDAAVFMIMGANIGTTLTAMLVSLGHIKRPQEFERAFAAGLLHLMFNLVSVAILFPLEMTTGLLTKIATAGQQLFANIGGMKISNPMQAATEPAIELLKIVVFQNPVMMLIVTIALTFAMLYAIVKLLRGMVLSKVEKFFDRYLFRNWRRAMIFGLLLTVSVQSSSISTSLAIPLAAAGVLKLIQIYPFNLGANVGTTVTAFLAALATGQKEPLIIAFVHVTFNVLGIIFIWSIPPIRRLPLRAAEWIAKKGAHRRSIPFGIIGIVYFAIPAIFVILLN